MLEKMKFERRENVKFWLRSIVAVIIFEIMVYLFTKNIYADIFNSVSEQVKKSENMLWLEIQFWGQVVLLVVGGYCLYSKFLSIIKFFYQKREKNIAKFNYNTKVDDFLKYLEHHGGVKLKLKLELDAPKGFEETILNSKPKFYVRRKGPEKLYIWALKGNEEIWHCTIKNDDDFLFEYFDSIYDERKEE